MLSRRPLTALSRLPNRILGEVKGREAKEMENAKYEDTHLSYVIAIRNNSPNRTVSKTKTLFDIIRI